MVWPFQQCSCAAVSGDNYYVGFEATGALTLQRGLSADVALKLGRSAQRVGHKGGLRAPGHLSRIGLALHGRAAIRSPARSSNDYGSWARGSGSLPRGSQPFVHAPDTCDNTEHRTTGNASRSRTAGHPSPLLLCPDRRHDSLPGRREPLKRDVPLSAVDWYHGFGDQVGHGDNSATHDSHEA